MWVVQPGDEWPESWAALEDELTRPDAALGAITFAMRHDPRRYSAGVSGRDDSYRVFRTRDWVDGNELWVYVHVSDMTRVVTLRWAHLAPASEA